jgi:hypothetical protein
LIRFAAPAAIVAALLLSGCGPKAITVGSKPFPAKRAVFTDASGQELKSLPGANEPLRLVMLYFPWCPACGDAWGAVREAQEAFPAGTVGVYRILFDREVLLTLEGKQQVPPLQPAPAGGPATSPDSGAVTLTALPGAFGGAYRVSQAPVIFLLDGDGTVARRWVGFSRNLFGELSEEIRTRSPALSPRPPEK